MKTCSIVAGALVLTACAQHPPAAPEQSALAPVPVKTERLEPRRWLIRQEAMGTVEARVRSTVSAQVMGVIRQAPFEAGQAVRAGQLLVTLEAPELHAALAQADAARAEALSAQPEIERSVEAARVQLDLAETSHRRIAELFAKKSVSPQEMDDSQARVRAARAGLELAASRRGQVEARAVTAAQTIAHAKVISGYTTVTAPFDGTVVEKIAQPGSLASPGAALLVMERAGGYQLVVTTPEGSPLRLGQPLTILWDDGAETAAKVNEVGPAVDAATRTQTVKAALPPLPGLRSGRFARARWTTGDRPAVTVPNGALVQHGQLQMVLVVDQGRLRSRMITAGEEQDGRTEVLSGLQPGDLVVVRPPLEWKDGAPARLE